MIADARSIEPGRTIDADVCVIGAGPAGLAIARALDGAGMSVLILESGGSVPEYRTQALARGLNAGLPYFPLDANRQRSLGGTTRLWAGWCRRLDELDFEEREWVPDSGWPIGPNDLEPWYERALELLGLTSDPFDLEYWEARRGARRVALDPERFASKVYRLAPTGHSSKTGVAVLRASENVRALLHANVAQIEPDEHCRRVAGLEVRTLAGGRFRVRAKVFVVAAGGIENARLLLASNRVASAGLGNGFDLVGRYFMEHMVFDSGAVDLPDPRAIAPELYYRVGSGTIARVFPTAATQREARILQACTQLVPHYRNPVDAAMRRIRARVAKAYTAKIVEQRWASYGLPRFAGPILARMYRRGSDQAAIGHAPTVHLMHITEQAPNRNSRVTLAAERDALGMPRVRLEWRTTELDEWTVRTIRRLAGSALEDAGLGAFRTPSTAEENEWPPPPLQGLRGHHMGTTRMHADPARGVVNPDCRVHGIENLFVAGSSVFPTSGAGIPTTTIVALALRLAAHLEHVLGG